MIILKADVAAYLDYRFEKIKKLKQNDKGEVWLAAIKATGELVVIKFMNLTGLPYAELKKLSPPFCAKVFYCAQDDFDTVVVEEFIQGESLAERENFLSKTDAQKILIQMCDGLKILHAHGIVHRDIKPSNLILQNGEIVKLIDFDAARIFKADKPRDTIFLGTKGYAPPEQYGYGQTDARSDIFSLGVTMRELTGKNCGERLKKILSKCTELDPKNRYQSVDELKAALLVDDKPRRSRKPVAIFVLAVFGIILFANSTSHENFPAAVQKNSAPKIIEETPAEIETPVENNPAPAEIKTPEKNFDFPAIVMPPTENNSSAQENFTAPKIDTPTFTPRTPQQNSPPPVEILDFTPSFPPPVKNFVRAKYFLDGKPLTAIPDFVEDDYQIVDTIMVNSTEWKNWQRDGEFIILPDRMLEVRVKNSTGENFSAPQLAVDFDGDGYTYRKNFSGAVIGAGQEFVFRVPLNQLRIGVGIMGNGKLKLQLSGGAEVIGKNFLLDWVLLP